MDDLGSPLVTRVAVLGGTGAIGGRFVEVVAGQDRAEVEVLVHRWWHTARVLRYAVGLHDAPPLDDGTEPEAFAAVLAGCDAAVSFVDGPGVRASTAAALVIGCARAGVPRLVHLGALRPSDAGGPVAARPDEAGARREAFEQALVAAGAEAGVEVTVVAAPLVYGPFTREGAIHLRDQVERGRVAVARGSGPCHLIYVDDVVEAVWAAASGPPRSSGRIPVSGPGPITWVELFEAFGQVVGRPAVAVLPDDELDALAAIESGARAEVRWPARPGTAHRLLRAVDRRTLRRAAPLPARRRLVVPSAAELAPRRAHLDVPLGRAAAELGWAPVVGFDEGMRRTEAYLRWADPR
ncbi:NAD-dependent epimerase/dehydratase family protein [Aquihabitans sp. McL0605]|uniref:NAD-dependent epimerase/dehydratase family protein n=1 Tax=Aquihabitans sp. McL0605 TaxID=3415671 RepID=UPI003CF2CA58